MDQGQKFLLSVYPRFSRVWLEKYHKTKFLVPLDELNWKKFIPI